ncbi:MAG TPA: S1C family serine protease [Burkholderiales bacterium]|nr:S1C family serine protease [Burkholderiales bacterium]
METTHWAFPEELQPKPEDVRFDLRRALDAVIMLRAEVPEDAFTAAILGTERLGNGVVIREDGLVLTIGYLITEARSVWLTTNAGGVVEGYPLAYDFATGFGLVQPLGKLDAPALARGSSRSCPLGGSAVVIGHGGAEHALKARIVDKREFAGYWEYVLDEALFTAPAHPQWGGSALIAADGRLAGIGSLLVDELVEGQQVQANMFVPVELLEPILDDLVTRGQTARPVRPWLGMYTTEANKQLVVAGVAPGGPAARAGVRQGDVVVQVAGERASGLADLFRKIWRLGPVGVEVPLILSRAGAQLQVRLRSADRSDFLKKPQLH